MVKKGILWQIIRVKLSDYAKRKGVTYRTAWNWYKSGLLAGEQIGRTIIVHETEPIAAKSPDVVIYARVSAAENKSNLDAQATRLERYCEAKGYQIDRIVEEIGSGVTDQRPKLQKLLADQSVKRIVVEHKDRLTRFGFAYLETLFQTQGRTIEVVKAVESGKEDLLQDFISIITSFCARIYGQGRSKRKTEKIIAELKND
jgi:putative resolvase